MRHTAPTTSSSVLNMAGSAGVASTRRSSPHPSLSAPFPALATEKRHAVLAGARMSGAPLSWLRLSWVTISTEAAIS